MHDAEYGRVLVDIGEIDRRSVVVGPCATKLSLRQRLEKWKVLGDECRSPSAVIENDCNRVTIHVNAYGAEVVLAENFSLLSIPPPSAVGIPQSTHTTAQVGISLRRERSPRFARAAYAGNLKPSRSRRKGHAACSPLPSSRHHRLVPLGILRLPNAAPTLQRWRSVGRGSGNRLFSGGNSRVSVRVSLP